MTAEPSPEPNPRLPIGGTNVQSRIAEAAIELFYSFGPTPPSPELMALAALSSYVALALLAAWVERHATFDRKSRRLAAAYRS